MSFANEIELIQLTSSLGISPPIIATDAGLGIIIFPYIEGKAIDLHNEKQLSEALEMIKILHNSKERLTFQATPEDFIKHYLKILRILKIDLTLFQQQLIDKRPQPILNELVPCHLDLTGDNFIDDGNRLWLIDWEYGGMSDPLMDLAQLTPSEYFSEEESSLALSLYDSKITSERWDHLCQLRILSNMRIALWCLIMSKISHLDHPYARWTDELFAEIEKELISKNHLPFSFPTFQ